MPDRARRIEILTFPGAQLLDVAGPLQVFATANDLTPAGRPLPYGLALVAATVDPLTTAGFALATTPLPPPGEPLHTLIVSGGRGVNAACTKTDLVDWVRRRAGEGERTASVCSGAFLLAVAGLLDGKRAVTHWQRCAEFAALFPQVKLDPDPIFVTDGAIWTSAGITAGIDMALAMVEADIGRKAALAVARQLVMFLKRPGGQTQFSAALTLQDGDGRFDALHAWILENLRHDLSLSALAAQARMSARSLSRHYRAATGRTPARAVELLRVEAARHRLEDGATVSGARRRCGFGSEETMRRAFLRHLGVGPDVYGGRFGHR